MEDILGIDHLNVSDANAAPMADVFTRVPDFTPYTAVIPGNLCAPPVDPSLVPACATTAAKRTAPVSERHDAAWWAENTEQFDLSAADRMDADAFNRVLWEGIMGAHVPYPTTRSGLDLRRHRAALLERWARDKRESDKREKRAAASETSPQ